MAIGHHIGDRSHTIEQLENVKTGHREERQNFVNLDDSELVLLVICIKCSLQILYLVFQVV